MKARLSVQGHPWLLIKFKVSSGYKKPYLKKKKERKRFLASGYEAVNKNYGDNNNTICHKNKKNCKKHYVLPTDSYKK